MTRIDGAAERREDEADARLVAERDAADTGERITVDELLAENDLTREQVAPAARVFWLVRLHNGRISHHSYTTEERRDKWAAYYRARGDRVETTGEVFIRG